LIGISNKARQGAIKAFDEAGCQSEMAKSVEKSLSFYQAITPGQLMAFLDEQIVKEGGKATPPEAFKAK